MSDLTTKAENILSESKVSYFQKGERTTIGFAKLPTGYELVVSAHTLDPDSQSEDLGQFMCYEKLRSKVEDLIAAQDAVDVSP